MEKPPQFLKEFSKEESQEERDLAASHIRNVRTRHYEEKHAQTERQAELQETTSEREQELLKQLDVISGLENEILEISTTRLGKIVNYFKLKKLRADAEVGERDYGELKQLQNSETNQLQEISEKLDLGKDSPALLETREILEGFYEEQKRKWAYSEYDKEDIEKHFTEEHLASLSVEDYALLLKRFPGEMVTHVTRQGIRDHIGHMFHTAGEGLYADNFMKMIEDGRLRSTLGVYLVEKEKEQAVEKFLSLDEFESKEEALLYLDILTGEKLGDSGSYVDKMAIHFATEEVADCYYGSEKGNEIFISYPSAYVASQYYFSGQLNENGGGYWNDQWVWANEEKGMDLNAGLIFVPEEARVDRETGSRYELDGDGNPVKNSEYKEMIKSVADSPDFQSFAQQVMEITGKLNQPWDDNNLSFQNQELLQRLAPFRQRLVDDFGIIDQRLQMAILNYRNLSSIKIQKERQDEGTESMFSSVDEVVEEAMKSGGILFSEAKDVISSKEFWENHFSENPNKKPSKIIYYKGSSPTEALYEWKKDMELVGNQKIKTLVFPTDT